MRELPLSPDQPSVSLEFGISAFIASLGTALISTIIGGLTLVTALVLVDCLALRQVVVTGGLWTIAVASGAIVGWIAQRRVRRYRDPDAARVVAATAAVATGGVGLSFTLVLTWRVGTSLALFVVGSLAAIATAGVARRSFTAIPDRLGVRGRAPVPESYGQIEDLGIGVLSSPSLLIASDCATRSLVPALATRILGTASTCLFLVLAAWATAPLMLVVGKRWGTQNLTRPIGRRVGMAAGIATIACLMIEGQVLTSEIADSWAVLAAHLAGLATWFWIHDQAFLAGSGSTSSDRRERGR